MCFSVITKFKLQIIKIDQKNKEKHNNFQTNFLFFEKLTCVPCGWFSKISCITSYSITKSVIHNIMSNFHISFLLNSNTNTLYGWYYESQVNTTVTSLSQYLNNPKEKSIFAQNLPIIVMYLLWSFTEY